MTLAIDAPRLARELETLASFSDVPAPAVTRIVYSEADRRARDYVKGLCAEAGLRIREDAVGNTFARWPGAEPDLPAVATGSHIDAIPHAGRYDGTVGVLGGLEAIRALQRAGAAPRRSIELIVFTAEEPTRYGIGCFGSRLLAGVLDPATLPGLDEHRAAAGFHGDITAVTLPRDYYSAFVELHIEQGPLLDRDGVPLGIVTAIAAPATWHIMIDGEGGHAGAVLMPDRRDAFCAAAEIVLAIESAGRETAAIDTVATVGVCDVFPGAVNSIPARVRLEVDVRDIDRGRRDAVLGRIRHALSEIAARRGVQVGTTVINADAPAQCAPEVIDALTRAAEAHNLAYRTMVSRAYHDSLFMSRNAPTAMLFIPCRNGISHRPDEYASPDAIAAGALVLAEALRHLAA